MTTHRDPDRRIRAFLAEGQTDLPDRTYDALRADIDRTRQRVVIGPWREPDMNKIARLAIAAAAVVVVAVVGYNFLPARGWSEAGQRPRSRLRRHRHRSPVRRPPRFRSGASLRSTPGTH